MLVLKWLKINCLMLYSQKKMCLVLSKYPHSDPPTGEWGEGIMMDALLKGKNVFSTVRTPGTELKIFANRMDAKICLTLDVYRKNPIF